MYRVNQCVPTSIGLIFLILQFGKMILSGLSKFTELEKNESTFAPKSLRFKYFQIFLHYALYL